MQKCQMLTHLVVPVAVWGTWLTDSAKGSWTKLQQSVAGALYAASSQRSLDLTALLQGHSLDLQFMAHCQTISLWARLCQQGLAVASWQARAVQGPCQYAVHAKELGWVINRAHDWHHPSLPGQHIRWGRAMSIGHLKHLLRASWRRGRFESWQSKSWRDATACAAITYEDARVRLAHMQWNFTCGHGRSVLMGGVVSPARMQASQTGSAIRWCPFFREAVVPDWAHCVWACNAFSRTQPARPPADALRSVLGWPYVHATSLHNRAVLDHLATVCKDFVAYRCA